MNGDRVVLDTSLIINLFNGSKEVEQLIGGRELLVSVITEIEVLSFPSISNEETALIKDFLSECYIIDIEPSIKDITIEIRSKKKVKLPDAIIAATAIYFDLPLFTMDNGFEKIDGLNAVILKL